MKKIYLLFVASVFIFSSCKDVVEGLNNDPNNYTDTNLSLILNHALLNVVSIAEADPARTAGIFTDQFMGVDRQYGTLNGYSTTQSSYDAIWEDFYQRGITQAQIAKQKAIESSNSGSEGQAEILEGYYFAEAALLFGDIPFSEVNQVTDFPDPKYDGQVAVINGAIALIEAGISKAGNSLAANNVFKTSSTWGQVGNALLARYHLALKDYAKANASAQAANFTSNANDWAIKHSSANYGENLFWQFEVEQRQDYLKFAAPATDTEPANFSYMIEMLDSSHPSYKGNAKTDESGRMAYYATGESLNTTNGFAAQTASFPVISFEEVQLIIAETEVLLSNTVDTEALTALNLVRANNETRFGGTYDPYDATDFLTAGDLQVEILKEKFCLVIGLPTLQDVNRTNNLIGTTIKNSSVTNIPQRFIYPFSETASNANFPGLVDQHEPTVINK